MRIALLGVDDNVLAIARAAQQSGRAEVILIDSVANRAAEASRIAPSARLIGQWEDVLHASDLDAVLVAGDDPQRRVEQLRRLTQLQLPTLVSHPVCLSMLEAYEIGMIHRESPGVLLAWIPARRHPIVNELWDVIEAREHSAIGQVEQIALERFMPDRQRESVLRQFAIDADLLQYLAGDATRLHALGTAVGSTSTGAYGNLSVQLQCETGLVCRWSVGPIENRAGARLTLVGSRGKLVLHLDDESSGTWLLESRIAGVTSNRALEPWDGPMAAFDALADAMSGQAVEPSWNEAARTIELAETIDRSLARGRTIDLHQEEFTDINTFKGTMASLGCGLLMMGLALVFAVAILHTIAVNAGWARLANVLGNWPYLLLAVLGVFLLMQLFVFVGKPSDSSSTLTADSQPAPTDDFR